MKWLDRFAERLFTSPVLWGGLISIAFHTLLGRSQARLPAWLVQRLTGQWESYVCTTMFLIALAFVVARCISLAMQFGFWHKIEREGLLADAAPATPLAARLEAIEKHSGAKRSLLYRRLQDAQQSCLRDPAASSLSTQLKVLSDVDFDRLYAQYGLLRTLIWAIPSCGSVATILAIAQVVERMATENAGDVLSSAAAGLSGAFNLFAFTVGLAIVLVVLKFMIEQAEHILLAAIDKQVTTLVSAQSSAKIVTPGSQNDQLRQVTEMLKSVATSLAQQAQNAVRVQATAPSAGDQIKDIQAVVQAAVATALDRQPAMSMAGGGGTGLDSAGWKAIQHVLQKLAHVLEQQNAKLETEGRVSKHLTTIIDEGLKEVPAPLGIHDGRQTALVSPQF
jgi:hypothetical protein